MKTIRFTRLHVAETLLASVNLEKNNIKVLDATAGTGMISDYIKYINPSADCVLIESNHALSEIARLKGHDVIRYNFLDWNTDYWYKPKFDLVILTPSFKDEEAIANLLKKALEHINPVSSTYSSYPNSGTIILLAPTSAYLEDSPIMKVLTRIPYAHMKSDISYKIERMPKNSYLENGIDQPCLKITIQRKK